MAKHSTAHLPIVTIDNEASTQYTAFKCNICLAEWASKKLDRSEDAPLAYVSSSKSKILQCMVCKTSFTGIRYGEIAYYRNLGQHFA